MYTKPSLVLKGTFLANFAWITGSEFSTSSNTRNFWAVPRIWSWNRAMALIHLRLEIGDVQKIKVMLMLKVPGVFCWAISWCFLCGWFWGWFKFKLMEIKSKDCFLGSWNGSHGVTGHWENAKGIQGNLVVAYLENSHCCFISSTFKHSQKKKQQFARKPRKRGF